MKLKDLLKQYIHNHPCELSGYTVQTYYWHINRFERFLGCPAYSEQHLRTELIDACLLWCRDRNLSTATLRGTRQVLQTLWIYAYEEGITQRTPRVKKLRQRSVGVPCAWTPEEVAALADACYDITGYFETTGLARGPYMRSLVLGMYSTALRLGDALSIPSTAVAPNGSFSIICSKTQRPIARQFSPEALDALEESNYEDRAILWPLWGRREALYRLFRVAVRHAKIRPGTSKWLRRAALTHVAEKGGYEAAQQFADHRQIQTTRQHYVDPTQITPRWEMPSLSRWLAEPPTRSRGRSNPDKNDGQRE